MKSLLDSVSHFSMSFLGNALLTTVVAGVTLGGVGLVALYMIENVSETPSMKSLGCMAGIARPDCPKYREELVRLNTELLTLTEERNLIEGQLAGLQAVETAVDEVTLFDFHDDPYSDYTIGIGTEYKKFTGPNPKPESYFCYIRLDSGVAGENRSLQFQYGSGSENISDAQLKKAGVSRQTLAFGRSVCKPYLIGAE